MNTTANTIGLPYAVCIAMQQQRDKVYQVTYLRNALELKSNLNNIGDCNGSQFTQ